MKPFLRIAATEILEQYRQPWMLFILSLNYILWIALFGLLFGVLDMASKNPELLSILADNLGATGMNFDAVLKTFTSAFGSLVFTNLPLYVAIMSGTSVLHDRERGTMPFLMLAPVTRQRLLGGKLVGVLAIPFLLHLFFGGVGTLLIGRLDIIGPYAWKFGGSPAWWVAFLVGAPLSAAFVGALGTVISALSKDMRTSMQFTSFVIGLLSLAFGFILVDGISKGLVMQSLYAFFCLLAALLTLNIGARLISRDITV